MSSRPRSARWVPWVLFAFELALTAVVIGILSFILVVQLTLIPDAIFGELDAVWTLPFSLAFTAVPQLGLAFIVFVATGLVVGIVGMPIRLVGPLRRAWLRNGEASLAGVGLGVLIIIAAYVFGTWESVMANTNTYSVYIPSLWTLLVGWLLLAFALSMLVWPARWLPPRARKWWIETQCTPRPKVDV